MSNRDKQYKIELKITEVNTETQYEEYRTISYENVKVFKKECSCPIDIEIRNYPTLTATIFYANEKET